MLRVEGLQFKRGDEVLFENLDFVVHPGQTIAVAGRNGVGKSTLFSLILGALHSDIGDISKPTGWKICHLKQEVVLTQRYALDYVVDGHEALRKVERAIENTNDPEQTALLHGTYQDLGGYEAEARAGEILSGLGFATTDFTKPFADFSGGWRIRLNLAQALMAPCELLLLDEPTNHLDLETIMWLENWIKRFEGTVIIIAHDRSFLDACASHTLYLAGKSGKLYSGNYSSCERQRAEQLEQEHAVQTKQAAQAAHIQNFVDRFRAKASKAKQVQSRIKALEKLQFTLSVHVDSPYTATFQNPRQTSNPLFSFRKLSLGYGATKVLQGVSQTILPGDRIGVLGANGAGKSTLLKALVGDLKPMSGELTRGQHSQVGYFAQHQLETLDASVSALATLLEAKTEWGEQQCRNFLGGWGFSSDMTTRPIHTLSGGEKARLVLALIALEQPAVLILDEPTNHLDLDMRDALALALQDYSGAVVIVSHDRALLEKTVDVFWVIEQRGLRSFSGDLSDYTAKQNHDTKTNHNSSATASGEQSRKQQRQARAQQREKEKLARNTLRKLETEMESINGELIEVEGQLGDMETYNSLAKDELDTLLKRSSELRSRLEQKEEEWLLISDQVGS